MLDISQLRKDLPGVVAALEARQSPQPFLDTARFSALEAERKAIQSRTEELQARRNALSRQIGQAKAKGEDTGAAMSEVGGLADELKASAERLDAIQAAARRNADVGAQPAARVGAARARTRAPTSRCGAGARRATFDFAVRDHVDLGAPLGLDFDTGAKLSGARFSFLRGPVARLHRALAQFMLDVQTTRARLHRVLHALHRQPRGARRHRAAAQVQGPDVLGLSRRRGGRRRRRGAGAVPDLDLGDLAHQQRARAGAARPRNCRSGSPRTARAFAARPAAPGATRAA